MHVPDERTSSDATEEAYSMTTHAKLAEVSGDIAKGTRVIAGVAAAGAAVAAPTGLTAVGVALGLTSAPLIVTAAPILIGIATAAATVSAAAHLYSKFRRRQSMRK